MIARYPSVVSAFGIASAALALLAIVTTGCNRVEAQPPPSPKPPEVFYTTPAQETVTEFEEFTGRIDTIKKVEIRARVSGYLDKVLFTDGADVKEGQLLFQIDPRWFRADADRAAAVAKQAKAHFDRLDREVARDRPLVETRTITPDSFDQVISDRAEAEASWKSALAQQNLTDLSLSYTQVIAPFSGRISRRLADPGNLIRADDTLLATIVALDPIYAYFDLDERTVLRMRRLLKEGQLKKNQDSKVVVQWALADEDDFSHTGVIDFFDNQVDATTGTLRLRAVIENTDHLLLPGLFVRLRFPIGDPHPALLVPDEALATDQGQKFVWVIGEANKVAYRRVKTGLLQGGRRVIEEGLKPDDRVVVSGLQRLRKDLQVEPKPMPAASPGAS
jgi:RND family efflux transporter MFP subunit